MIDVRLDLEIRPEGKESLQPVLAVNFPDPSVIQGKDEIWYAFATESGNNSIQVATSEGSNLFGDWKLLDTDALPEAAWTSGRNTWAPDVRILPDGSYIMYFTGELPNSHQHCIGVARSQDIAGPYKPDDRPWECPRDRGGAIDASGFLDPKTRRRYVTYKVDGESSGDYTPCGSTTDDPNVRTPLMLQEVSATDGSTKIGQPIELVDRIPAVDGALIEAPSLTMLEDGTYVLFFSSHCFFDEQYDVKYAWSDNGVEGPYQRIRTSGKESLLRTPDFGLNGPGGATASTTKDGEMFLAFHGNCEKGRCMYITPYGER